jgi:hypothetical protein
VRVMGPIDLAHSAGTYLRRDLIAPESLADHWECPS